MQFNVFEALIECMNYVDTRITEGNSISSIEAAKLLEVKGLSEMDLLSSGENIVVSSLVAVNKNCTVENFFATENIKDAVLENCGSRTTESTLKTPIDKVISFNLPNKRLSVKEDSSRNLIAESTYEFHSKSDSIKTLTEIEEVLLSLVRSYIQKQFLNELQNSNPIDHQPYLQFRESSVPKSIALTSSTEPKSLTVES